MHKLRGAPDRTVRKNPRTQIYVNTTSMENMRTQNVRTGMDKTWNMQARRAWVGGTGCNCPKSSEQEVCSQLCRSVYWLWCVRLAYLATVLVRTPLVVCPLLAPVRTLRSWEDWSAIACVRTHRFFLWNGQCAFFAFLILICFFLIPNAGRRTKFAPVKNFRSQSFWFKTFRSQSFCK